MTPEIKISRHTTYLGVSADTGSGFGDEELLDLAEVKAFRRHLLDVLDDLDWYIEKYSPEIDS